jgi:hypothetical protein
MVAQVAAVSYWNYIWSDNTVYVGLLSIVIAIGTRKVTSDRDHIGG